MSKASVAQLRGLADQSSAKRDLSIANESEKSQIFESQLHVVLKMADSTRTATMRTQECSAIVEGSLEALGPQVTSKMLHVLGDVNAVLQGTAESVTLLNTHYQSLSAASNLLAQAWNDLESRQRDLIGALTVSLRSTSTLADSLENLIGWCKSYVGAVVAERLAWQERCGVNPAQLPANSFFSDLCLRASQLPDATSLRQEDSASAVVQRFVSRVDSGALRRYATPREELALLRELLSSSGIRSEFLGSEPKKRSETLFQLRHQTGYLRSQVDALRDAVKEWRSDFISELCIVNEAVETKRFGVVDCCEASVQTEVKQGGGKHLSRALTQSTEGIRASKIPLSDNLVSVPRSEQPRVQPKPSLSISSERHPPTTLRDAFVTTPRSDDNLRVDRAHAAAAAVSIPIVEREENHHWVHVSPLQFRANEEDILPVFSTKPSAASNTVARVDEKLKRALQRMENLQSNAERLETKAPVGSIRLADSLTLAPIPPAVHNVTASRPQTSRLAAARINRTEFDRWLETRFGK